MASSSAGNSIPAPDAVKVLVTSLADESPLVRKASMASLNELAPLKPLLILDCCLVVSRGGRRRFGNMAGVFQVMAFSVGALEPPEVDPTYMTRLAHLATSEIISSKELNANWQRAASRLLVAIGSHLPDLMMEEIFQHFSGQNADLPAMVRILADFATSDALQFVPRLKGVLSRVLPILGNVRDVHRPIFANAFKCWCQACWQYRLDFTLFPALDGDVMSFLDSVFELLLRVWATSRDLKVRTSAVEALGQMVGLVHRTKLKAALPKLIQAILEVHAALPRMVLHLHDEDLSVRQACRNTLQRIAPLVEKEGMSSLFNSHRFSSDHRCDYQDFLRDLAKQFTLNVASRVDTYMASIIQAYDSPWPIIQANAIYLSSSMLALSDDQHISAAYYCQVFGLLVGKANRSTDAIVRASCSSALGLLLKSSNSLSWRVD